MKRLVILVVLATFGMMSHAQTVKDACKWGDDLQKRCKKDLKPFSYYAFKITKITFTGESQFKEVEVPLFHSANYRFVFNTEGLSQNVRIEIYDKPANVESRKKIYTGTSNEKHFVFDPPKSSTHNRIYINYIIPASGNTNKNEIDKGCVIFYSGFKH
ncbi:MAG: hypothetical protein KDC83_09945 [Flavobacteriales bacterium]|nr:hypothetical protein [Flavobacteriales bacterium]